MKKVRTENDDPDDPPDIKKAFIPSMNIFGQDIIMIIHSFCICIVVCATVVHLYSSVCFSCACVQ